jgi:cytidyltransferase-like protein
MSKIVAMLGAFDDLRSRDVRLLEEASKLGQLTALVFDDDTIFKKTGNNPKFPLAERLYLLTALRFVSAAVPVDDTGCLGKLPGLRSVGATAWIDAEGAFNEQRRHLCREQGIQYQVLTPHQLEGFPEQPPPMQVGGRKKIVVTGCFDWFHSGHVSFFEEVGAYGDLYVIVGHDANIRLLKGQGHPLVPQEERRYMVGSVRCVSQALVSSGDGWLDADPEIQKIRPDVYAVNEDGDRGGKREYCAQHGIEYMVLKRTPAPGLPPRSSTVLRGF